MLTQMDSSVTGDQTPKIVEFVKEAAEKLRTEGESIFTEFATSGSRWRQNEKYIFVLDARGNMLVHA